MLTMFRGWQQEERVRHGGDRERRSKTTRWVMFNVPQKVEARTLIGAPREMVGWTD